jgi:hypothetical protein
VQKHHCILLHSSIYCELVKWCSVLQSRSRPYDCRPEQQLLQMPRADRGVDAVLLLKKEINRTFFASMSFYVFSNAYGTFSEPGYSVAVSSPGLDGLVVCVSLPSRFLLIGSAVACRYD